MAHTAPEAVCAGVIFAEDRAGNDLADAACKLVVLEHRAPRRIRAARHSANLAVTCMAHWIARIGSARQRRDIDDVWLPGRGRALAARRERTRPWPLPLPVRLTVRSRGHTFVDSASKRLCALCQHPELLVRGRFPGTAGSRVRCAAQQIGLEGSTAHTIVDLRQGGKVVCAVCGWYGGRVVRHSLLSTCPGAPTPGRRLALRDVLLGFLAGSKRGAVGFCSWRSFTCLVWSLSHQGPSLPVLPSSTFLLRSIPSRKPGNLDSSTHARHVALSEARESGAGGRLESPRQDDSTIQVSLAVRQGARVRRATYARTFLCLVFSRPAPRTFFVLLDRECAVPLGQLVERHSRC